MSLHLPNIRVYVVCLGYQDCRWEAGAGHWRCTAPHLHLLLPDGLQREHMCTHSTHASADRNC